MSFGTWLFKNLRKLKWSSEKGRHFPSQKHVDIDKLLKYENKETLRLLDARQSTLRLEDELTTSSMAECAAKAHILTNITKCRIPKAGTVI